jgi:hypothetical protein
MVWNDTRGPARKPGPSSDGPVIDMTPDGAFVDAPRVPFTPPLGTKVMGVAIVVAVLAGMAALALLALWVALHLIPIAIGAGLVAYGVFRFQAWRAGKSIGSQGGTWLRR